MFAIYSTCKLWYVPYCDCANCVVVIELCSEVGVLAHVVAVISSEVGVLAHVVAVISSEVGGLAHVVAVISSEVGVLDHEVAVISSEVGVLAHVVAEEVACPVWRDVYDRSITATEVARE